MENLFTLSTSFLSATISIYTTYIFFYSYFSIRANKLLRILTLIGIDTVFTGLLYYTEPGLLRTVFLILFTLGISFLFKSRWYNHLLLSLLYFAICTVIEYAAAALIALVFEIDMMTANSSTFHYITGLLLSKLLIFVTVMFIRIKRFNVLSGRPPQYMALIFIFPISTIGIIILQYNYFLNIPIYSYSILFTALISYSLLIFSNISIFYYIDIIQKDTEKNNAIKAANSLIKHQEEQYTELLANKDEILKLRHDYKNFLIGILSEIKNKRFEQLQTRIEKEYGNLMLKESTFSDHNIVQILFEAKAKKARENGVILEIEHLELSEIQISLIDIAILLGNALDNAIEAAEQLHSSESKKVFIFAQTKNNTIVLIVKNYVSHPIDTSQLKTSKQNKLSHGYGILSMKKIAQKYDGEVSFIYDNNVFKTYIVLRNEPPSNECAV